MKQIAQNVLNLQHRAAKINILDMKKISLYVLLFFFVWSCKSNQDAKVTLPDMSVSFNSQLHKKDSTLLLDSFRFIRLDTFSQRKTLVHERFPLLHIQSRINGELAAVYWGIDTPRIKPDGKTQERINYLNDEKNYVAKQIDSLNRLIRTADSLTPVGYRLLYRVTVRKSNQFIISDTISYSLDKNMNISEWNSNIDHDLDSLSIGHLVHPVETGK